MECPRCQRRTPTDAAFCDECGARLDVPCQSCGQVNRAGAKFCRRCGHTLAVLGNSQPRRFASPEDYLPPHLIERILTSRAAVEGERKQVTVLFADMAASLELLTERDPEEARAILDPVIELMMDAVHRYEGLVNQAMGDGIMALFGAPIAHEDHALRACHAALAIQRSIEQYGADLRSRQGVNVQVSAWGAPRLHPQSSGLSLKSILVDFEKNDVNQLKDHELVYDDSLTTSY
jgi:Double zinc ribbon/Adenylate and Guanylate cyclase catalytic domain